MTPNAPNHHLEVVLTKVFDTRRIAAKWCQRRRIHGPVRLNVAGVWLMWEVRMVDGLFCSVWTREEGE
jgi:hypothetical protein